VEAREAWRFGALDEESSGIGFDAATNLPDLVVLARQKYDHITVAQTGSECPPAFAEELFPGGRETRRVNLPGHRARFAGQRVGQP
jgi:hypothetical protein